MWTLVTLVGGCALLGLISAVAAAGSNVRLTSTKRTAEGFTQGQLEVLLPNRTAWSPICSNLWDDKDADVACRQLGFASGRAHTVAVLSPGSSGKAPQPAQAGGFRCSGKEAKLLDCPYERLDAGLNCTIGRAGAVCVPKAADCALCLIGTVTSGGHVTTPATKAQCDRWALGVQEYWARVLQAKATLKSKPSCKGYSGGSSAGSGQQLKACATASPKDAAAALAVALQEDKAGNGKYLAAGLEASLQFTNGADAITQGAYALVTDYACPGGARSNVTTVWSAVKPKGLCGICIAASATGRTGGGAVARAQCNAFADKVTSWARALQLQLQEGSAFGCTSFSGSNEPEVQVCTAGEAVLADVAKSAVAGFEYNEDAPYVLKGALDGALKGAGASQIFTMSYECAFDGTSGEGRAAIS